MDSVTWSGGHATIEVFAGDSALVDTTRNRLRVNACNVYGIIVEFSVSVILGLLFGSL